MVGDAERQCVRHCSAAASRVENVTDSALRLDVDESEIGCCKDGAGRLRTLSRAVLGSPQKTGMECGGYFSPGRRRHRLDHNGKRGSVDVGRLSGQAMVVRWVLINFTHVHKH